MGEECALEVGEDQGGLSWWGQAEAERKEGS